MEDVARNTGFLRRKRVLVPHALVLALLKSLGMGKAEWIADILHAYNALTGASLRYKPFHNQLKKRQLQTLQALTTVSRGPYNCASARSRRP